MSTLRNIDIHLDKICRVDLASEVIGGSAIKILGAEAKNKRIFGWAYVFEYDVMVSNARQNGMNLDSYLTTQIAFHLNNLKTRKSPIMVWFSSRRGLALNSSAVILLHITSRRGYRGMWIEGADEMHSLNYLHENAEPFMYYDGTRIFRTYLGHRGIEKKNNLLCNLDGFNPYRVSGPFDQQFYDEIVKNPFEKDNIYYSPILMENEFICQWREKQATVERVFCNIKI